jgi:sucrose-6-phosphate hydrolase SacC (GH32 family)
MTRKFRELPSAIISGILFACLLLLATGTAHCEEPLFPPALTRWVADPEKPVFEALGSGTWEARIRERGWIIRDAEGWKLWYTGYRGERADEKHLGLATSKDGIHWIRHPGNPVIGDAWVEDVCVIHHDGTYQLFCEGVGDRAQRWTSPDGINWTHQGPLQIFRTNGEPISEGPYGTPTVYVEDGVWHLFYERRDLGIWLAKSTDLVRWEHVQDDPVLVPGPGDYDRDQIALNQIVKLDGRYFAVFHGSKRPDTVGTPSLWATGLAVSDDLVHWTKYSGNPLRPVSENKSSGQLVHDGQRWLLYTLHDKVFRHVPEAP